jgi:hypothetical protein
MILFLLILYFNVHSTLTQSEIKFICIFDGVQGFNIPCINASSACDPIYSNSGIYCDSNNSITTVSLIICNFTNIIPNEINKLPFLTTYSIVPTIGCKSPLSGIIPKSIGLCNLTYFGVSDSNITGTIPNELMNNTQLLALSLKNTLISGTLPSDLNTLNNLIGLDLTNNNLYGSFPDISNLINLGSFFISGNKFIGSLPNISRCHGLYIYDVSDNLFTKDIPVFNSSILYSVDLSANKISSTIPNNIFINSYSQLVLSMKNNLISGTIPSSLFSSNMIVFDLSGNKLSGTISPNIINIAPQIQQFIIERNYITGSLPSNLNNAIFPNCFKFNIANNLISGTLPSLSLYNLTTPYLGAPDFTFFNGYVYFLTHNNKISGVIPSFAINSFLAPTTFDLSQNMLTLDSNSFSNIENNISYINLQYNNITYLPPVLFSNTSKFVSLKSLNLASNFITGTLPSLFKIQYLNLERNLFTGAIPSDFIDLNNTVLPIFVNIVLNRLDNFKLSPDINFFPQDVDDCLLNTSTCQICVNGWFPIGSFTCDCLSGFVLNPIDKVTCDECAITNWSLTKLNYNNILFPKFRSLGYNISLFDFAACDSCSNGKAFRTRSVISNPACSSVSSIDFISCSFPCSNLEITTAQSSLYTLQTQFEANNFLNQIIYTLFGINVTIFNNKRANNNLLFNTGCGHNPTIVNEISNIISALTLDIVPNIPQLSIINNNCSISLTSIDIPFLFPYWSYILIFIGTTILIILIILSISSLYYYSSPLHYLPKEINYSFLNYIKKPFKWTMVGDTNHHTPYYYRTYKNNGANYNKVYNLLNKMNLNNIGILEITAIYNPNLTLSFINNLKIMNDRFINNNELFFTNTYNKNPNKVSIIDHYYDHVVSLLKCNENLNLHIIPALHGTDKDIAFKIAGSGFSALSLADQGWFCKGIYFSSLVCYCLPYACMRRNPTIILSYLNMGHVFPVDEKHDSNKSLLGSPIKSGYNSCYVVTNKKGHAYDPIDDYGTLKCDELVISQESQALPAFIITLDPNSASKEYEYWQRVVTFMINHTTPRSDMIKDDIRIEI